MAQAEPGWTFPTVQNVNSQSFDPVVANTPLVPGQSSRVVELETKVRELREEIERCSQANLSSKLEMENVWLRKQIDILSSMKRHEETSPERGATSSLHAINSVLGCEGSATASDIRERAALRLQRSVRGWFVRARRQSEDGAVVREQWKRTLREVEVAVDEALQSALGQIGVGRVPRQTRLRLLANALKQGVLKVNQAVMHQTLQEMRKSSSSPGPTAPLPLLFEH